MAATTDSTMRIRLSDERTEEILRRLTGLYAEEFDEELSRFRAERILAFFQKSLGASVYNQAIQDARGFMMERLEDLDATFHEKDELAQQEDGQTPEETAISDGSSL